MNISDLNLMRFEAAEFNEIVKELERIGRFPYRSGYFTFLHHLGPILEPSDDVLERVAFIINKKPVSEVLKRLRNIHYVSEDTVKFFTAMVKCYSESSLARDPNNHPMRALSKTSMYQQAYGGTGLGLHTDDVEIRLRDDPHWQLMLKMWLRSISREITWDGNTIFALERVNLMKNRFPYQMPDFLMVDLTAS